jgi:hypothetical protein
MSLHEKPELGEEAPDGVGVLAAAFGVSGCGVEGI